MFKAPTKKSTASAANKNQWMEEEDEKLRNLYDQYRLEEDCLQRIISEFDERRNKQQIIKRMLQLHIIADKSEIIPKKKSRAKTKKKENNSDLSDDNEYMEEPVFDDLRKKTLKKVEKKRKTKVKKNEPVKRNVVRTPMDIVTIRSLIAEVNTEKYLEAIEWLKECLNDAAEDTEELADEYDGVPIVPLTEIQREAMEDAIFKKLLLTFGIQPPIVGMEAFWRIPTYLSAADLKMRAKILAGEETEEQPVEVHEQEISEEDTSSEEEAESEEDYLDNLERAKVNLLPVSYNNNDKDEISNEEHMREKDANEAADNALIFKKLEHRKRKPYESSSEEEENGLKEEHKTAEEQHVNDLFDQLRAKHANKKQIEAKEKELVNGNQNSRRNSESDEDVSRIEKKLKLRKRRPILSSDDEDDAEQHKTAVEINQEQHDKQFNSNYVNDNTVSNEEERNINNINSNMNKKHDFDNINDETMRHEQTVNISLSNKRQRSPTTIININQVDDTTNQTECNSTNKKQRLVNSDNSDSDV